VSRARAPLQASIFGGEAPAKPFVRSPKAAGYAAQPGTGPEGETCGSCSWCRAKQMRSGRRFYKCGRMTRAWTHGRATDICLRSPACSDHVRGTPRQSGVV
jgi:hypothetical protein